PSAPDDAPVEGERANGCAVGLIEAPRLGRLIGHESTQLGDCLRDASRRSLIGRTKLIASADQEGMLPRFRVAEVDAQRLQALDDAVCSSEKTIRGDERVDAAP